MIEIILEDHTGNTSKIAKMSDTASIQKLIPALITALELPITDPAGHPVRYNLWHNGHQLKEDETLVSAGVLDGDTLTIVPEITRGEGRRELLDLIESLKAMIKQQAEGKRPIVELTAPVELPTADQMKVKLVPSHLLSQLEETRSDENYWSSVGWAFLGAVLGVIVNWATAEQMAFTRSSLIIIIVLFISGALAFAASRRHANRARVIRSEMVKVGIETAAPLKTLD
jgi:uncharacterized ubiquitin-like protein YukD